MWHNVEIMTYDVLKMSVVLNEVFLLYSLLNFRKENSGLQSVKSNKSMSLNIFTALKPGSCRAPLGILERCSPFNAFAIDLNSAYKTLNPFVILAYILLNILFFKNNAPTLKPCPNIQKALSTLTVYVQRLHMHTHLYAHCGAAHCSLNILFTDHTHTHTDTHTAELWLSRSLADVWEI